MKSVFNQLTLTPKRFITALFAPVCSISSAEAVKIWDIETHMCLVTVAEPFKHPEFWVSTKGLSAFLWHDDAQSMLVAFGHNITVRVRVKLPLKTGFCD